MAERRDVAGHAAVRHEGAGRLRHAERHAERVARGTYSARGQQTRARVRQVRAGVQAVLSVRPATQGCL